MLTLMAAMACGRATDGDPSGVTYDADRPFFITQNVAPNAVMDALFQGRVVADAAGCLRLDSPDRVTVIWPRGFTLEPRAGGSPAGGLQVHDARGRSVGRIGGEFRLGGGEVPWLPDGIPLAADVRQHAVRRCPGIFWIVGEIPD
jgi:hypothetical protein